MAIAQLELGRNKKKVFSLSLFFFFWSTPVNHPHQNASDFPSFIRFSLFHPFIQSISPFISLSPLSLISLPPFIFCFWHMGFPPYPPTQHTQGDSKHTEYSHSQIHTGSHKHIVCTHTHKLADCKAPRSVLSELFSLHRRGWCECACASKILYECVRLAVCVSSICVCVCQ